MRRLVSTGLIKSLVRGDGRKISRYEVDDFIERNQGKNLDELLKAVEWGMKLLSLDTNNKNVVTLKKDGKVIADIVFKDIKTGKKISVGILNKKVLVK